MFYRYLHDPAYALLRDMARKDGLFGQVEDAFRKMRRDAEEIMVHADGERVELPRKEWQRLIAAYPKIATVSP